MGIRKNNDKDWTKQLREGASIRTQKCAKISGIRETGIPVFTRLTQLAGQQ